MFETAGGLLGETLGERKGGIGGKTKFFHAMLLKENSGAKPGLTEKK